MVRTTNSILRYSTVNAATGTLISSHAQLEPTSVASWQSTQWTNRSSSCVVLSVVPTLRFIPAAIVWVALERYAVTRIAKYPRPGQTVRDWLTPALANVRFTLYPLLPKYYCRQVFVVAA